MPDIINSFSITFNSSSSAEQQKIKWFRKNKQLTPVEIKKWEDDKFIYFDLVYNPYVKNTEILDNCECNVCYEKGKSYYIEPPFVCNHNEVCVDCNNKIFKTSKKCCICRANLKT